MTAERLDKLMSDSGLYSRSEAKALIRAGRVTVDGETVRAPERKFPREADVRVDGGSLNCAQYRYFMLDKPAGYVCANEDRSLPTVLGLLPEEYRKLGLFTVGRLDRDTTGLLILTNDGDFAHRVISPKSDVEKCYEARIDGETTPEDAALFAAGLRLGDGTLCLPAKLESLGPGRCRVSVREGKYHQVKRMLAAVGKPVLELRRISIGELKLKAGSRPGSLVELDKKDLLAVLTQL